MYSRTQYRSSCADVAAVLNHLQWHVLLAGLLDHQPTASLVIQ